MISNKSLVLPVQVVTTFHTYSHDTFCFRGLVAALEKVGPRKSIQNHKVPTVE